MTSEQVDILRWLESQHREKKLAMAVPLTRDSMRITDQNGDMAYVVRRQDGTVELWPIDAVC